MDSGELTVGADRVNIIPEFTVLQGGALHLLSLYDDEDLPENTVLKNGAFSNRLEAWTFEARESSDATYFVGNRVFHVQITDGGGDTWDISLSQHDIAIVEGKSYEVTFKARAVEAREIQAYSGLVNAPFTRFNKNDTFSLTTEWQTFTYQFTVGTFGTAPVWLRFDFGKSNADVYVDDVSLVELPVSSVHSPDVQPLDFVLYQNYPNPFNPTTTIQFSVPSPQHVKINIFDVNGKLVSDFYNNTVTAGLHQVEFDASHLSSGVYFYKLTAGEFVQMRKMMLVK